MNFHVFPLFFAPGDAPDGAGEKFEDAIPIVFIMVEPNLTTLKVWKQFQLENISPQHLYKKPARAKRAQKNEILIKNLRL